MKKIEARPQVDIEIGDLIRRPWTGFGRGQYRHLIVVSVENDAVYATYIDTCLDRSTMDSESAAYTAQIPLINLRDKFEVYDRLYVVWLPITGIA